MGDWEVTSEPLKFIATEDPDTCTIYAKGHGLLFSLIVLKQLKSIDNCENTLTRMVNQAKLSSAPSTWHLATSMVLQFLVRMIKYKAMHLDKKNKNSLW